MIMSLYTNLTDMKEEELITTLYSLYNLELLEDSQMSPDGLYIRDYGSIRTHTILLCNKNNHILVEVAPKYGDITPVNVYIRDKFSRDKEIPASSLIKHLRKKRITNILND
jgi:hypothetical protein